MPILRAHLSGTPLERELHLIDQGLSRTEWDATLRFDHGAYPADLVARVAAVWRARMVFEHRSSTVFSQLAHQLFEANAPLDCKVVMLRMAQDELRHTATCSDVVRELGGDAEAEADLVIEPLATHRGVSLEERALRNVIYTTCCSEMVACARFVAVLDGMTDPYLKQQTRRLLADEVLHGRFGFYYLESMREWLDTNPEAVASLERYLAHAFAVIERELAPQAPFPTALTPEETGLGLEDPRLAHEVFYGTMTGAIVPGLERFGIDAGGAWKRRARVV